MSQSLIVFSNCKFSDIFPSESARQKSSYDLIRCSSRSKNIPDNIGRSDNNMALAALRLRGAHAVDDSYQSYIGLAVLPP